MAEVTGPISTLPGHRRDVPEGTMCDCHPDRLAVARVQGETDSFGCEMIDMCEDCVAAYREECRTEDSSGTCDWCRQEAEKRFYRRDIDEGSFGPVYQVCRACVDKDE